MLRSNLSENEANAVTEAIRSAAEGDNQKIAGASDFCRILVETMEVGVTALIAAAFHFCAGVSARELCAENESLVAFWDNYLQSGIDEVESFGLNIKDVVLNAASLKRIELITLSIVQNEPGSGDAPRLSRTELLNVRSLLLSETRDWRALAIRLAACLYRLRGILDAVNDGEKKASFTSEDIYSAREALHVFAPLASRLGMHRVKNEIEGLAFRILYRRQYSFVSNFARVQLQVPVPRRYGIIAQSEASFQSFTTGNEMKKVMRKVTDELTNILYQDPSLSAYAQCVRVTARVKEPFSLWKKMLRKRVKKIDDIPDAIALRVVIDGKKGQADEAEEVTDARERALCYYVQKICSDAFKPLKDGRPKDYITHPKPNGYQSLHYTACTESSGYIWPFEIQIRSGKMHQVAEFGLASHWEYEEQCRVKNGRRSIKNKDENSFKLDHSSASYLRSVQEWHWQQAQASAKRRLSSPLYTLDTSSVHAREERLTPYLNAFVEEQSDLTREQVFVFMPSHLDEKSVKRSNKGRIIALPAGSCIIDALRESNYDHSSRNFDQLKLTQKLRNGDILAIPRPSKHNPNLSI
jgi:(p)ppGpp synthase/HD superfamily hydrolase